MFEIRWTVQSPWPPSVLADRIRVEPRWNGWRDGFADGRFLIAEQYPVEVGLDGFCFVVPSSHRIGFVVCHGRFHPVDGGTRVELRATLHPAQVAVLAVMALVVLAVFVIGLWSVSPLLAIGLPVAAVSLVALIWAVGFRIIARYVRSRVTDFLNRQ
jgi:hypothetical protein